MVVPVTSLYKVIAKNHYSEHRRGFFVLLFPQLWTYKSISVHFLILKCHVLTAWKQILSHCIFQAGAHCRYGGKPWICRLLSPLLCTLICAWFSANLKNMGTLLSSLPDEQSGVLRDAFVEPHSEKTCRRPFSLWKLRSRLFVYFGQLVRKQTR